MNAITLFSLIFTLLLSVVVPLLMIAWMTFRPCRSRLDFWLRTAVVNTYIIFLFLAGPWDSLSVWVRYLTVGLLVMGFFHAFRKQYAQLPVYARRNGWGWTKRIVQAGFALLTISSLAEALQAHFYPQPVLALTYPLQEGYIVHGGSTELANYHNADTTAQRYALDIVALNQYGTRAAGWQPARLHDYAIYGDTVYSPCNGRVVGVQAYLPDQQIGGSDTINLAGNHILLAYRNHLIVLAHLLPNSVRVQAGDRVFAGQALAQVGNSGNTSEPHLHLHAVQDTLPEKILTGKGVPVTFGGRFYVRNQQFGKRDFEKALEKKSVFLPDAIRPAIAGIQSFVGTIQSLTRLF